MADLEETQGDTFGRTLNFTDDNGVVNITGWTIYVTVKESFDQSDADAPLSADITSHDDAAGGVTSFSFSPTETADLEGSYVYEIKYEDTQGEVETIESGVIRFEDAVRVI